MPPPLAGWAAGLDLVAVPDGLALNVRTFLHRAPSLDPTVRVTTAERLATQLAGYVRTPAPAGTPAEAYLAAVLAERTRRASSRRDPGWAGDRPGPRPPGRVRRADADGAARSTAHAPRRAPGAPGAPSTPPTGFTMPR